MASLVWTRFLILVLRVILTCEFCCVTRVGPKEESVIWERFVRYWLGPNWPENFFPVFPTYVQELQQSHPPILPCRQKCWGLSQSSQDLALQLGIKQLHLRLYGMPASLPWPREPRPCQSQSLQASHFLESLGLQTQGVLPGITLPALQTGAVCQRHSRRGYPAYEQKSQLPRAYSRPGQLGWPGVTDPERGALVLCILPRIQAGLCLFKLEKAWMNKRFFKQKHCRSRNKRFSHEVYLRQENSLPCFLWLQVASRTSKMLLFKECT